MKVSKKYNRIGWAFVAASLIGTVITVMVFGSHPNQRSAAEFAADFATGMLVGAGVWYWGKAEGAKELGA